MSLKEYLRPVSNYFFGQMDKRFYYQAYSFFEEFGRAYEVKSLKKRRILDITYNNLCNLLTGASITSAILINPSFGVWAFISEGFIRNKIRKDSKAYKDVVLVIREVEIESLNDDYELEDLFNS